MDVLWNQRSPPFSRAWVPNLTEHTPQQGSAFCLQWLRKRARDHASWGSFPEGTLLSPSLRGPTFLSGPRPILLSFGFCSGSYPIFFQYCLCLCSFVLFLFKVASVGFCYLQPKNLNWHRKLHRMAQLFSAITQKAPKRFSTVPSWVTPAENMNMAQLLNMCFVGRCYWNICIYFFSSPVKITLFSSLIFNQWLYWLGKNGTTYHKNWINKGKSKKA